MSSAQIPSSIIIDARTCTSLNVTSSLSSCRATLQRRCQRAYGWDAGLVHRIFVSYLQFLTLKVVTEDFDAEYLSPSFLVDQMWHQHLLDNRHYEQFCHSVCPDGRQIYHDPEGGDDVVARQQRIVWTQTALKERFDGAVDHMVWGFDIAQASGTEMQWGAKKRKWSSGASNSTTYDDDDSALVISSNPDDNARRSVILTVVDKNGEEQEYKILQTSPMQLIFEYHSMKFGVGESDLELLRDGQRIDPEDTPARLKLAEGCTLHCSLVPLTVTIALRRTDSPDFVRSYKLLPTTHFSNMFCNFAQEVGSVDRAGLRFLVDGEQLLDTDTSTMRDVVNGDTIDCMLEQGGS
jgi:hypothetical protein